MPLTIAVLGAGIVGRTLAAGWVAAGHRVILGSRDPAGARIASAIDEIADVTRQGDRIDAALHVEAAAASDIVVITVTGGQVPGLLSDLGAVIEGKPVIDTTNDLTPGAASLNALHALSKAGAIPYRTFNSVGWEQMKNPRFGSLVADMFYAGPASHAATVEGVITDLGFRGVHLGDTERAVAALDALARLWFLLAFDRGYGRRLGFRLLTADDDAPTAR